MLLGWGHRRSSMRSIVGTAAILLAAFLVPTRSHAQYRPPRIIIRPQPPPPPGPAGRRYVEMDYPTPEKRAANLTELLDLTEDQKQKVTAIFVEQDKQSSAVWADDSLATDARNKKLAGIRAGAARKVRDLLTDEQKKKYDALGAVEKPPEKIRLQPDPRGG